MSDRGVARREGVVERLRTSVWGFPMLASIALLLLTLPLLRVRAAPDSTLAAWTFAGDAATASGLLQTVATSAMTAASLTFSLTVVALQLASQQFSPRLLREFARDRLIQVTMALLISAFVVALVTLRAIDPERDLPVLAVTLVLALGVASALVLLAFIGHMVRSLRIDTMMVVVHQDARRSAFEAYLERGEGPAAPGPELPGPAGGTLVLARRSGFVRSVDAERLVQVAREHAVLLRLGVRPGDSVVAGSPIASAWSCDGRDVAADALADHLPSAVVLGHERTEEQDVAFGFRQLVDIAVKAVSPAVNDPTTAAEALGYCADLLVLLQGRRLGPQVRADADGVVRVVLPDRDHRYYLDLTCAQVRRFGRSEPTVLTALLRLLRDCAASARDAEQRQGITEQVDLVLAETSDALLPSDADEVRDLAARVRQALAGDLDDAYRDRAGETRSI